jgi:hypothetical protein
MGSARANIKKLLEYALITHRNLALVNCKFSDFLAIACDVGCAAGAGSDALSERGR